MKTSARVHVGRASLDGGIARYARAFNLLEVIGEHGRHPKRSGLLEWKKAVPDGFVFSVVVPAEVAALAPGASEGQLMTHAEGVAEALDAAWWVLRTPPEVPPSPRAIRALTELAARLRAGGRRVAWEPRGMWSEEAALDTAAAIGVRLVRDLAREDRLDDDDVVYTRLRALGEGARIGAAAAERVADRLDSVAEAFVVVEGAGAARVRTVLREAFGASEADALDLGALREEQEEDFGLEGAESDGEVEEDEA